MEWAEIEQVGWDVVEGVYVFRDCGGCNRSGMQLLERGVENVAPGIEITRVTCRFCGVRIYEQEQIDQPRHCVRQSEVCDLAEVTVSGNTINSTCGVCGHVEAVPLT
jgi:hypothetical protein